MNTPGPRQLEQMLNDAEVAALLGVSRDTVRRWIRMGKLTPFYKLGRLVRIPKSAVSRFLEAQKVEVPA